MFIWMIGVTSYALMSMVTLLVFFLADPEFSEGGRNDFKLVKRIVAAGLYLLAALFWPIAICLAAIRKFEINREPMEEGK